MKKILLWLTVLVVSVSMVISFSFVGCKAAEETTAEETTAEETVAEETTEEETTEEETATEEVTEPVLVPEEGASLLVWEDQSTGVQDFVAYVIDEFNKIYPDIEVTFVPVDPIEATPNMELTGPTGEGADVFAAPHDHLGRLVSGGIALENDMIVPDEFLDAAIVGTSYDGTLYGYPAAIETYGLFYNKDIIDTTAQSFDEVVEFAGTFNDPSSNKFGLMWDVANAYFDYIFPAGYGAYLFGPTGTDRDILGFDTQAGIDGLTYFQSLREIYNVDAADANYDAMMASFREGNAAYIINGPWAFQECIDAGLNFGVIEFPVFPNGNHPVTFSGIRAVYVSAFTEYPNAAKLFAEFMTSPEMLQKRYELTAQIPPRKGMTIEDEYSAAILAQAAYAVPMPSIPEMDLYWTTMGGTLANIWNGSDVTTEVEAAAASIREGFSQ